MRTFLGTTAVGVMCLLGAATFAGVRAEASQAAPAAPERPPMTEEVFRNVALLRGIPVDTFFDVMGMFANAMGNDCTYCHAPAAVFNRAEFATSTPRLMRARQMITMVNAINKTYFAGEPRVTCFTCHSGNQIPRSDPDLALQYGTPIEDPNARDFPDDPSMTAGALFDKYLEAVGGAERIAGLSSFVAKGTYSGFDTGLAEVPVEIFARAPNQYTTVVHMSAGDSVRVYDGRSGWIAGPETPLPLMTLSAGNLDRARLEALVAFPAGIPRAFGEWRVGRAVLDDDEVFVVQASEGGQPVVNLYFDDAGLLTRLVRWTQTPIGFVPTQIDYADYREVAGVRMPFRRTVTQTYMQMVVELSDVQPNVQIDAARFAKPAPASP
jgi:hypothetical protein